MKFKRFMGLCLAFQLFLAWPSFAQEQELKKLFQESFWSELYVPNYCGDNILEFVILAQQNGLDLQKTKVLWMESTQGKMRALKAREKGSTLITVDSGETLYTPGEVEWYYHVVLESEGLIFDFDYTNGPYPQDAFLYFHHMFIPEEFWSDPEAKKQVLENLRLVVTETKQVIETKKVVEDTAPRLKVFEYYPQLIYEEVY